MPAVVRRLETADAAVYRAIRLEGLERHPEAFGAAFEEEALHPLAWFEARLASSAVFGAWDGGALLGIAGLGVQGSAKQAHKGFLWGMYVRKGARGRGIGTALVEAVLDHARGRVEHVDLRVVTVNETARRLYERHGFTAYGTERHALKIGDRYFDEVMMVRETAAHPRSPPGGP